MTRAFFLCVIVIGAAGIRVSSGVGQETVAGSNAPDSRPNILFCIADDWAWPHASAYGDPVVKTPTFDRVARQGVLFDYAYVAAPTCTASRGAILSGQTPHRLREGGNLWSRLPGDIAVYPDLLEEAGYVVGHWRKAWGPGTLDGTGRTRNPAGPTYPSFDAFLRDLPDDKPFCFWAGASDPHRPYAPDSGAAAGLDPSKVHVPAHLPDTPVIRRDLCDYYFEVERFDREIGEILRKLEAIGRLHNTIVMITGDNGMPFPAAKATCYDAGVHVPFAVQWPAGAPGGRRVDDFVSMTDVAPTLLEAAGLKPPPEMTGRGFLNVLTSNASGQVDPARDLVFTERERHGLGRGPNSNASYPIRMIRTHDYIYVRNLRPDLSPSAKQADPDDPNEYLDVDGSPTKTELVARRDEPAIRPFFELAFGMRPEEQLFDAAADPACMRNLAGEPEHADVQARLREKLDAWMTATRDPRAIGETDRWDDCIYVGRRP